MNQPNVSFTDLDLGSVKPIPVPMRNIEVVISAENLLNGYAKAWLKEARRVNPGLVERVGITQEELEDYAKYLLTKRIECVAGDCKDFRKLKVLYIPVWIQYNLSMIGEVLIRDRGIKLTPVMGEESEMTFEQALEISDKIGAFEDDLQVVKDAMPRKETGDRDVMSTAMIAGYAYNLGKVEHVSSTYVAAFLGMKLREEVAFRALYEVQYDDIGFIASALFTERGIFR